MTGRFFFFYFSFFSSCKQCKLVKSGVTWVLGNYLRQHTKINGPLEYSGWPFTVPSSTIFFLSNKWHNPMWQVHMSKVVSSLCNDCKYLQFLKERWTALLIITDHYLESGNTFGLKCWFKDIRLSPPVLLSCSLVMHLDIGVGQIIIQSHF